jgi:hypothetical protein
VPECSGGDPKILRTDGFTTLFQEAENFAVMPRIGFICGQEPEI